MIQEQSILLWFWFLIESEIVQHLNLINRKIETKQNQKQFTF